tara:strand:+ start:3415 stop:4002 length:588 start_codon:yes stop_codon:yes gene_type:complete
MDITKPLELIFSLVLIVLSFLLILFTFLPSVPYIKEIGYFNGLSWIGFFYGLFHLFNTNNKGNIILKITIFSAFLMDIIVNLKFFKSISRTISGKCQSEQKGKTLSSIFNKKINNLYIIDRMIILVSTLLIGLLGSIYAFNPELLPRQVNSFIYYIAIGIIIYHTLDIVFALKNHPKNIITTGDWMICNDTLSNN